MNWDTLRPQLVTFLKSQGLIEYQGKELTFEKGGNAAIGQNKNFIIRVEALDEKSITSNGSLGSFKIAIEVLYPSADQKQNTNAITSLGSLVTALHSHTNFVSTNGDPLLKQIDGGRLLGIIKCYYGIRES